MTAMSSFAWLIPTQQERGGNQSASALQSAPHANFSDSQGGSEMLPKVALSSSQQPTAFDERSFFLGRDRGAPDALRNGKVTSGLPLNHPEPRHGLRKRFRGRPAFKSPMLP